MLSVLLLKKKVLHILCICFLFLIAFFFASCDNSSSNQSELDGIYTGTSHDPEAREFMRQENIYIQIEKDSIFYHSTINRQPKFHIKGNFTTDDKENLAVVWEAGNLPAKIQLKDTADSKYIQIGNTLYIK